MTDSNYIAKLEEEIAQVRERLLSLARITLSTDFNMREDELQEFERLGMELCRLKQERRRYGIPEPIIQACEKRAQVLNELKILSEEDAFSTRSIIETMGQTYLDERRRKKQALQTELNLLQAELEKMLQDRVERGLPVLNLSVFDEYSDVKEERYAELFRRDAIEHFLKDMNVNIDFLRFTTDDLSRIMHEEMEKKEQEDRLGIRVEVLQPDLDDVVFSDVFSNLNTGLPKKKPSANKNEIPTQTDPKHGFNTKASRLNDLLRDCNAKARELNERLRALNATMRERLGE